MPKSASGDRPHSCSAAQGLLKGARGDDILHALPTAVVLLDMDGTIAFSNHVAQRQLGLHATGKRFVDLVEPADRMVVEGYMHSHQATEDAGVSRYVTCALQRLDSSPIHMAITGAPVSSAGHRGLLLNLSDITSRMAEALRRAGRKTDQVFRKGDEEFVMVLPMADPDAIGRVAEHLAEHLAECVADLKIPHAEGPTGWLSALIVGVSALPSETVGQAIVRAGNAAMHCKATGVRAQIGLTK